jgi:hypothetical protein
MVIRYNRKLCENDRKTNVPISVPAIYPIIVPNWNGLWTELSMIIGSLLSFAASDAVTSRKANDTS